MPDPTQPRGRSSVDPKMTPLRQKVLALAAEHPEWGKAQIARVAGCTESAVWKTLNPKRARDLARKSNAKRGDAKRAWAKQHRAACPGCGQPMAEGTVRVDGSYRGKAAFCGECRHTKAIFAMREMVRLRREYDMPTSEIAERLGMTAKSVGTQMKDLRSLGLDLPHDPYNRPKNGRRRHTPRSISSVTLATVLEAFPDLREVDAYQEQAA